MSLLDILYNPFLSKPNKAYNFIKKQTNKQTSFVEQLTVKLKITSFSKIQTSLVPKN